MSTDLSIKKNKYNYNVFIDLDKTLLSVDSGSVLAKCAHKEGLMRTRDILNGLYLIVLYKMEWRDTHKIINSMALWMKGIKEIEFIKFANRVVSDFLLNEVRPELRKEIQKHKRAGGRIIMLSASLNYVCEPIGESLGFDHILCSSLELDNDEFTGKPNGHLCFGKEKLVRLEQFYLEFESKPDKDYYYADSYSDVYVMRKVGYPVVVDPDRHLKRHAKHKGWRVL